MAPRRNTSRNGGYAERNMTVSNLALRESRPIPYTQTPPADPPLIRLNRPVDYQLTIKLAADSGGMLTQDIVDAIRLVRYGTNGASVTFRYTLNYIHAWADPSLNSADLNMTDVASGVAMSDNGGTTHRARVGLHYPKVLQSPRFSSATSDSIVVITTSPGTLDSIDLRVGVTVW